MKEKTNTKTTAKKLTAEQIEAALAKLRALAPIDEREHSDRWWSKWCNLSLKCYNAVGDDEDTECETHRGFSIVWNRAGVWKVSVAKKSVRRVA